MNKGMVMNMTDPIVTVLELRLFFAVAPFVRKVPQQEVLVINILLKNVNFFCLRLRASGDQPLQYLFIPDH